MVTETGKYLNEIKVGDRVWVGESGLGKKHARIVPVLSRTLTLISVPYAGNGSPHDFRITQWEHDGSWHAYESPSRQFGEQIFGIATPAECAEWEKQQAEKSAELHRQYEARVHADSVKAELQSLLDSGEVRNVNYIQVANADWGTREENCGLFDVHFRGLTESEVRELAKKFNPATEG
jgi:hypothetical protein